jgi:hypothetical protein
MQHEFRPVSKGIEDVQGAGSVGYYSNKGFGT